ncbi:MAG: nuclear transport factor 2 family protein [Phycisphaerae bacterium]|nr:nuclear transport factor 2 family protein [Phycisphaerae bacterium]
MAKKDKKRRAEKKDKKSKAKKGKKKGASLAPREVKTGKGATPAEIGADLVSMFNAGHFKEIEEKWWGKDVVSVEGVGVSMEWRGRKAVEAKNAGWLETHTIHGASAEGPYVGATGFAVKFRMDVEDRSTGERTMMEEVGVYTIERGKIVREEFMYGTKQPVPATT